MDQIDIERTLRLRLGRTVHEYHSDEITGRLDVLVRSHRENLFVVELKREDSTLTDDDRDQGISYARRDAFNRFMAGSGAVFAITGESGVGKTNEMCALAEDSTTSHIALFFSRVQSQRRSPTY